MSDLPADIDAILVHLARFASGYSGGGLPWQEKSRLKDDLMKNRGYWTGFQPEAVRDRCLALGMRPSGAQELADLVRKAQDGRRLVPRAGYRSAFHHDRQDDASTPLTW